MHGQFLALQTILVPNMTVLDGGGDSRYQELFDVVLAGLIYVWSVVGG